MIGIPESEEKREYGQENNEEIMAQIQPNI